MWWEEYSEYGRYSIKVLFMSKSEERKNIIKMLLPLFAYAILLTVRYYEGIVNCLNTTTFAFSYSYGFKARAFMGTVLRVLDRILPWEIFSYRGIVLFSVLLDALFVALLLILYYNILIKSESKYRVMLCMIFFIFSTFAFPHFLTEENLGRTDICMAILVIIGLFLLLYEKCEWLIVVLNAVAVCIHQGYVLMFFNVFLAIFFARAIDGHKRKKSIIIMALSIVTCLVLFVYLNFYSHGNGNEIYDEIYATASGLAHDGAVHRELMMHEVLGENPFTDEWKYHVFNFKEFILLAVLMCPYIIIATRFFYRCIRDAKGIYKLKYLAIALGSLTLLPDFVVKIDYGRWVFALLFYYFLVIPYYIAQNDKIIVDNMLYAKEYFCKRKVLSVFLLIYPVLFTPLGDWKMTEVTTNILRLLGQGAGIL